MNQVIENVRVVKLDEEDRDYGGELTLLDLSGAAGQELRKAIEKAFSEGDREGRVVWHSRRYRWFCIVPKMEA